MGIYLEAKTTGLNWNVLMVRKYHTMQVKLKHSFTMGFHENLEGSKKKKICSMLSSTWTDRTNLKIPIFSILTTGKKNITHQDEGQRKENKR